MSQKITITKDFGNMISGVLLNAILDNEYGSDYIKLSTAIGNGDDAEVFLKDAANPAALNTLLADLAKPTCTVSGLQITVNAGTVLVNDQTTVTNDPDEVKFIKVILVVDDVTGDLEVKIFEKTPGDSYAELPAGKTKAGRVKEYSIAAGTSVMTEVNNWIEYKYG